MTRRPDPFSKEILAEALRESGCPESFVSSAISNYRLFVPLLFARLGEERVFEVVYAAREELGLGAQEAAWRSTSKYLVKWAEQVITTYKQRRDNAAVQETPIQPRLF